METAQLFQWITTYAEHLGFVFGVAYVWLAIKKNYWCWVAGLLNVAMLMIVFYRSALYGAAILQMLYFGMSLYGLILWTRKPVTDSGTNSGGIKRVSSKTLAWIVLFIVVAAPISGYILSFTDNAIPYWDGFITAIGLAATWMTARKLVENWLVWIVGDVICVVIYTQQSLYPTAGLYLLFAIMAVIGYRTWKKPDVSIKAI